MKSFALKIGILSALLILIGVIFKVQHYTGAGILLVIGNVSLAIGYAPILFILRNKNAINAIQKFFNIYVLLLMLIIPISFLFKMMHWPGAGIGVIVGNLLLLIFIPIFFIYANNEKEEEKRLNKFNQAIILLPLVAFSIMMMVNPASKMMLESFLTFKDSAQKETKYYAERNQDFLNNMSTMPKTVSDFVDKANLAKKQSDELVVYIKSIEEALIELAEGKKVSTDSMENLMNKGCLDAAHKILLDEKGKGPELQSKIEAYNKAITEITNTRGKALLAMFFDLKVKQPSEDITNWAEESFKYKPLIHNLVFLEDIIAHIRLVEKETVENLYFQALKVMSQTTNQAEVKK